MHEDELGKLISICHSNLKNSKDCISYLRDRGLDGRTLKKYKIGYFPRNIKILEKHISSDFMGGKNISDYSSNSDFSNYFFLIFPIYSEYGDAVGISGRTLLEESERQAIGIPKYKNSSYKKSSILFGLNDSRDSIVDSGNVYIVEGYFDQIAMDMAGIKNSVAICGTAFSQNHFVKLARYSDKITFILDADDAGRNASYNIYNKFLNKGIKMRFLQIPDGYKDIDEYFSNKENSIYTFKRDFKQIVPGIW
jgi:DNA primase|tara:strand:- start:5613 stop:6365 length:753 start_codon:yes stop_codon:yes gene_type:complete